jgi:hypothetical protein
VFPVGFLNTFFWEMELKETTQTSDFGLRAFLLMGITLFHSSNKDWTLGTPKNEKKAGITSRITLTVSNVTRRHFDNLFHCCDYSKTL